jgi:hypothetical protein
MADPDKLRQFMMKVVGDIGAAVSVPLVRTGIRSQARRLRKKPGFRNATRANGSRKMRRPAT